HIQIIVAGLHIVIGIMEAASYHVTHPVKEEKTEIKIFDLESICNTSNKIRNITAQYYSIRRSYPSVSVLIFQLDLTWKFIFHFPCHIRFMSLPDPNFLIIKKDSDRLTYKPLIADIINRVIIVIFQN